MKSRLLSLTTIVAASLAIGFSATRANAQYGAYEPNNGQYGYVPTRQYAYPYPAPAWPRPQFFGGYNTGPTAGYHGFYRRTGQTSRFGRQSYAPYDTPYYLNGPSTNQRRFGGNDFYGF